MALVLKDRVKQAAAAPGTGTITLGATATGFQSFASVGNANTTYFAIVDPVSGDWEVNYGTYTSSGTTLTRNATPLSSSAGGALVNFTGAVDVFLTYPSSKAVWQDVSGVVVQQSFGAITATSAALTSGTITGAPVNATDIVNKEYADSIASGLNYHQPVNYASTAALPAYTYNNGTSGVGATITANANGALSLGGGSPTATQRVLVKDEVSGNAPYNGIYVVTQAGSAGTPFILTRATDYDTSGTGTNEIDAGDYVLVISGTLASTAWVQQTPLPITVGTTAITFLQFNAPITYTAGTGLNLSPATTFNISNTGVTATTYGSASAVPVVTFNAQGQATGVTNTTIAIAGSQVSGNISGQAGSVANALTLGTYLTGGTYNGSGAVTATVDATSANTASKVVARDSSGNFSAGTITATLSGSSTSATTATNLAGGAANQIPYQTGSGATSFITAASGTNTVLNFNGSTFSWSAGTISGVPLGSNLNSLTAGTYLTGTAYNGSAAQTWTVDATSANTASKVVARDASGNFSAGTVTAALSGNATTATTAATANALNTANSYTGAGFTAAGASAYITANRTLSSSGEVGYTWSSAGSATWYNYLSTSNTTLNWYSAASATVMSLTTGGALNTVGAITQNGSQVLTAGNYNSYAPTLTGTGASGTWGINITGNAATATSATTAGSATTATTSTYSTYLSSVGSYVWNNATASTGYYTGITNAFVSNAEGFPSYGDVMTMNSYPGGSGALQLFSPYGSAYPDLNLRFRTADYSAGGAWTAWKVILDAANYNSYAPTLTGTGASGTWGINITGSAGSAGSATTAVTLTSTQSNWASTGVVSNVVGMLGWKNYGNSHVIFDASNGTSPSGGAVNNTNAAVAWSAAYPTLMGWNGGTTFGVRVDSARISDSTSGSAGSVDFANLTNKASGTGTYTTSGDYRAPIFYDSDNTGYYVDPASTSNLNTTYISSHFYTSYNSTNPTIRVAGASSAGLLLQDNSSAFMLQLYGVGNTYGFLNAAWAGWDLRKVNGGSLYLSGESTYYYGSSETYMNRVYGVTDIRSPIYYDLNDTAFYTDPNSISSQKTILLGYTAGLVYNVASSGVLTFGSTSDPTYYSILTQLENYNGDYSKLRFKWYTGIQHYASNYYGGHRFYDITGTEYFGIAVGSTNTFSYSIYSHRAPIFYDLDNTSYYGDFASTSVMNNVQITTLGVGTGGSGTTGEIRATANVTAYYSSDIKFKTNVRDIPNALEIAESIGGKLFDWTDEYIEEHGGEDGYFIQKSDFGVIAQDVLKVFPVAVRTRPDGSLAVDYEKLSAVAFAAVASLSTRVKSLEARI